MKQTNPPNKANPFTSENNPRDLPQLFQVLFSGSIVACTRNETIAALNASMAPTGVNGVNGMVEEH